MKSVLLGQKDTLMAVYPLEVRQALSREAGLNPDFYLEVDELSNFREQLRDTRFIFSTWGMPQLSEDDITRFFPSLEAVFYAAGSVQYFARPLLKSGIRVFSAWGANAVPVAEFTLAQILLANKGYFALSGLYSRGGRPALESHKVDYPGNYKCKVGIIGAGMIGKLVIKLLRNHNLEILVFDPFLPEEKAEELKVEKVDLPTLFASCQTVSNHLANNAQTEGTLNYDLFSRMLPGAVFINTGRGAQVVESDLCRLLIERPDVTAVLDVTWPEPPEEGHLFYTLPNVVMTPHIAGSIGNERQRMSKYMLEEFRRYINNDTCLFEVTELMLTTLA
jgi:phosphoglycerate dehydrogenase-like enzyme